MESAPGYKRQVYFDRKMYNLFSSNYNKLNTFNDLLSPQGLDIPVWFFFLEANYF
jgi:hypothetical protein